MPFCCFMFFLILLDCEAKTAPIRFNGDGGGSKQIRNHSFLTGFDFFPVHMRVRRTFMEYRFCPFCGNPLITKRHTAGNHPYCKWCKVVHYRNPTVGVAVLMMTDNELLLVKRLGSYKGMWCIPCGHVEWGEDVRSAAYREFKEETGLDAEIGPVFSAHSNFHDPEKQTVGIWFLAKYLGGKLKAGSDAGEAAFFPIDALPEPMAFPTDLLVCEQLKGCLGSRELSGWRNFNFII